jgi:hypothetical protein
MPTNCSLISDEELNYLYGNVGKTFKTQQAAIEHAKGIKGARIYPLWDTFYGARERIGFLVSVDPPEPKPLRYTGKVRQPN